MVPHVQWFVHTTRPPHPPFRVVLVPVVCGLIPTPATLGTEGGWNELVCTYVYVTVYVAVCMCVCSERVVIIALGGVWWVGTFVRRRVECTSLDPS